MIVNHRHKFIFYHVTKTGGTSVRRALRGLPGSHTAPETHITPLAHMAASSPFTRWRTRGYTRFCFVRHPFERFGSTHRFLLRRGKPVPADINEYAALLADGDPSVVKRNLLQWHYAEHVDFVGRFERLGQDFDEICRRVGISARLDHYNSSGDKISYTRDFTARTVGNLGDYFKEDFERLGYIASLTQPERSP